MKTRIFLLTLILVFFSISSVFAQQNPDCVALSRLKSNDIAQVVTGKKILIHAQPDENSPVLGEYSSEPVFSIGSGPNCKGNLPWWPIQYKREQAWISETEGKSYNIVPYVMPTPSGVFPTSTSPLDPEIISIDNASRLVEQVRFGSGWPIDVDWSPDGKTMAVATSIGVRLYDVTKPDDSSVPFELLTDTVHINGVAFSPDGHLLAAVGQNGVLYVWNIQSRQLAYSHKLSNEIKMLSFSPDGKWLAFTEHAQPIDADRVFSDRLWLFEAQTGVKQSFINENESDLKRIAFSDDGQRLIIYYQHTINVYHIDSSNKLISESLTGLNNVSAWALSEDGKQRAVLQSSGEDDSLVQYLSIQDAQSHKELINKDVSKEPDIKRLLFNPNGDLLFSVDRLGRLYARSPKTLQIKGLITESPELIIFSPDKSLMATASFSDGMRVFTTPVADANGTMHFRQLKVFSGIVGAAWHIMFSPDQTRIAAIGSDKTIRIWDLSSGKALAVYRDFIAPLDSIAVSPNGALLAARGDPNNLYLWDTQTGEHLETFKSFSYRPIFSPDNTYLMALGLSLETWDIEKGIYTSFKRTNGLMGENLTFLLATGHQTKVRRGDNGKRVREG